jgi:hypothetical protein
MLEIITEKLFIVIFMILYYIIINKIIIYMDNAIKKDLCKI